MMHLQNAFAAATEFPLDAALRSRIRPAADRRFGIAACALALSLLAAGGPSTLAVVAVAFMVPAAVTTVLRRRQSARRAACSETAGAGLPRTNGLDPRLTLRAVNALWALIIERRQTESEELAIALGNYVAPSALPLRAGLVSLADEMESVRRYVEVERFCSDGRLIVDVSCAKEAECCRVPARLLAPIVERAIDLGVARTEDRMMLTVFARRIDRALLISIRSETTIIPAESLNTGDLVEQRASLRAVYGDRAELTVDQVGNYSTAVISILDAAPR